MSGISLKVMEMSGNCQEKILSWKIVAVDGTGFYPRDAMLARVFATATCPSVRLSHAGIVPSRAKAGS